MDDLTELAATDALLDALARGRASRPGDPAARLLAALVRDIGRQDTGRQDTDQQDVDQRRSSVSMTPST